MFSIMLHHIPYSSSGKWEYCFSFMIFHAGHILLLSDLLLKTCHTFSIGDRSGESQAVQTEAWDQVGLFFLFFLKTNLNMDPSKYISTVFQPNSAAFLHGIDVWLPPCVTEFQVAFLKAATQCNEKKDFKGTRIEQWFLHWYCSEVVKSFERQNFFAILRNIIELTDNYLTKLDKEVEAPIIPSPVTC